MDSRLRLFSSIVAIAAMTVSLGAGSKDKYGVVTINYDGFLDQKTAELGTGSVRIGLNWFEIEPQQDVYNWARADDMISRASNRGLQIFATLAYSPSWAAPNCGEFIDGPEKPPSAHCAPYSYMDWAEFVYQVLWRYRDRTNITYGIWNEPNLFFLNDDSVGSKYGLLFQHADLARSYANPSARLAGPETSHHAYFDGYINGAGFHMGPYFRAQDVVTVHWYTDAPMSLGAYMNNIVNLSGGRETWLTETGVIHPHCTSESNQNSWVTTINSAFGGGPAAWTKYFWFLLHTPDTSPQGCAGLVRPNGSNKPAFTTYQGIINQQKQTAFYWDINYSGSLNALGVDTPFVGWTWNDQISSVYFEHTGTVVLYEHENYGGASLVLTQNAPDLRAFPGPGLDGTWNDAASSIRFFY